MVTRWLLYSLTSVGESAPCGPSTESVLSGAMETTCLGRAVSTGLNGQPVNEQIWRCASTAWSQDRRAPVVYKRAVPGTVE
ncbi:hypothetical protein FKP32DRAFT_351558 [Trametes sanguinea]|nr:hypothetical protein FKP32DRAFT_351558 [Trametes sanguinea]